MRTTVIDGIGVSPGVAGGPVAVMPEPVPEPAAEGRGGTSADDAGRRVDAAATAVSGRLAAQAENVDGAAAEVLRATAAMAQDPALLAGAKGLLSADDVTPQRAVWLAAEQLIGQLRSLGGPLADRARDVADVRDRIVAELTGRPSPGLPALDHPFVLVARDLAPAETATIDPAKVLAIVTEEGSPTSHTAILARTLGVPAVVGVLGATDIPAGQRVLVDGSTGTVDLVPSDEAVARAAATRRRARRFDGDGRLADGLPVALLANVGGAGDARAARKQGAQGVGLFRTEFLFLDRTEAPSRDEQLAAYRGVLAQFPDAKVVVRTLDAGADKPLPFVTDSDEPNPALGVRGMRTAKHRPEVLDDQLAALGEATSAERADVWVMAPMIATPQEAAAFVERCARHGLRTAGVMVEVPAAAVLAEHIMEHAAFASIGTNDLTQYTMAADRQLSELADLSDHWQPAVLRLVAQTCAGAAAHERPVGVCGEAAADPMLAAVLVGLGVSSLSMNARAIGDVAEVLRRVSLNDCQRLAAIAASAPSAAQARRDVRAALPFLADLGL